MGNQSECRHETGELRYGRDPRRPDGEVWLSCDECGHDALELVGDLIAKRDAAEARVAELKRNQADLPSALRAWAEWQTQGHSKAVTTLYHNRARMAEQVAKWLEQEWRDKMNDQSKCELAVVKYRCGYCGLECNTSDEVSKHHREVHTTQQKIAKLMKLAEEVREWAEQQTDGYVDGWYSYNRTALRVALWLEQEATVIERVGKAT